LLEAVQSREFTAPVNLIFECTHYNLFYGMFGAGPEEESDESPDDELMDLLSATLRVNNGLRKVTIVFDADSDEYLMKLTQELACIENLEFEASSDCLTLNQLGIFTQLVSRNVHLKSFQLNLKPNKQSPDYILAHDAAVNLFLKAMNGQQRLEHLVLDGVPDAAQEPLAELILTSEKLTRLEIGLETMGATPPLLASLCQNSAIQALTLKVDNIEDDILPLINLFKDNKLDVREFALETGAYRRDKADFIIMSQMISLNLSLKEFCWTLKSFEGIDFVSLALALKNNVFLESLELKFADRYHDIENIEQWIHASGQIPSLLKLLSYNETLASFVLSVEDLGGDCAPIEIPGVAAILQQKKSYRDYACSRNFVYAAASKFFSPYGMPNELSRKIAEDLLQRGPRILAGSLALVNKATYAFASEVRQFEALGAVEEALAPRQSSEEEKVKMVELLRRLSVSAGEFSDQTLCQIAASPFLAYSLNKIGSDSPEAAERLKIRFLHAAGAELIERQFRLEAEKPNLPESEEESDDTKLLYQS
jgi:hypothetical protein